jgi:O-antigen/teichoic acid export membrane protein
MPLAVLGKLVAPEQKSVRAKLVRNVLFSGLRTVVLWPVPFLLIPFILRKIGTSGYGTWAVLLTVIGLTGLADLGIAGTLTKQIAEHHAKGDLEALDRLINTALVLYFFLALILVTFLWFGSSRVLLWLFRGSGSSYAELLRLWRYALAIVGLNIVSMPSYSVVTGLQRMDLTTISSAVSTLGGAFLTVLFLCLGWGVRGLLAANLLGGLSMLVLFTWMMHRLLPTLVLNPLHFRWAELRRVLSFSLQLYVVQMTVAIQNQVEKLYLVRFVGVVSVGWYNIASDAAQKIRRIPELLLAPVIAAASELDARGEAHRVEELYHRLHKYLAFIGVPLSLYAVAISGRFVDLWLGPALHVVAFPLTVLVWVNFLNLTTGPGFLILVGKGLLRPALNATLVGLFVIVTLSFALIYGFGFSGAVVGILIAVVVATVLFFYWFYRISGYSFARVLREGYLKPTGCSLAVLMILMLVAPQGRLGWVGLSAHALTFGVLYVVGLFPTRFFDAFDLAQLEGFLPIARLARRIMPAA